MRVLTRNLDLIGISLHFDKALISLMDINASSRTNCWVWVTWPVYTKGFQNFSIYSDSNWIYSISAYESNTVCVLGKWEQLLNRNKNVKQAKYDTKILSHTNGNRHFAASSSSSFSMTIHFLDTHSCREKEKSDGSILVQNLFLLVFSSCKLISISDFWAAPLSSYLPFRRFLPR